MRATDRLALGRFAGWALVLALSFFAGPLAYATPAISLTSPTTSRAVALSGSGLDYPNDQQATARDLELVGNAANPMFYIDKCRVLRP